MSLQKTTFSILILVASIYFSGCSGSGGSDTPPKSSSQVEPSEFSGSPGDCKEFIKALPENYFHDWIYVPENPFDLNSPKIQVFYYGPKILTNNVVIFYNGGPGSDSHGTHTSFEKQMSDFGLSGKISFIYMDQRGTGCSSGYPYEKTDENILRSRWYGSTGIVYDSEAIRHKLIGDRKWKIFGQSYGAFVVHRYVSLFPESVEAAYAHANTINADPMDRLTKRIFSQHRVLKMYLDVYPDDQAKLKFLKDNLAANKCFETQYIGKFCGHDFLGSMVIFLGFSNRWVRLHNILNSIVLTDTVKGTLVVNDENLKNAIRDYFDQQEAPSGYALSVIGYYDRNIANSTYDNCKIVYAKLQAQNISEDQLLMNECMPEIQAKNVSTRLQKIKSVLKETTDILTLEKFKSGLLRLTPLKFYLYSGEKDAFVPKESFPEELSLVGSLLNYTHFMDSGHEGYRTEKQVWDNLIIQ